MQSIPSFVYISDLSIPHSLRYPLVKETALGYSWEKMAVHVVKNYSQLAGLTVLVALFYVSFSRSYDHIVSPKRILAIWKNTQ